MSDGPAPKTRGSDSQDDNQREVKRAKYAHDTSKGKEVSGGSHSASSGCGSGGSDTASTMTNLLARNIALPPRWCAPSDPPGDPEGYVLTMPLEAMLTRVPSDDAPAVPAVQQAGHTMYEMEIALRHEEMVVQLVQP